MSIATQITRINTAKADIKEEVNQDFEKIQDETITYYPEKIAETIEEYKKYIPEKGYSGTEINVDDAVPLRVPMIPKGNTYQAERILPEGYTQVDYIESSGTQYIDTEFKPNGDTVIMSKNTFNANSLFGVTDDNQNKSFIVSGGSGTYKSEYVRNFSAGGLRIEYDFGTDRTTPYELYIEKNKATLTINGIVYTINYVRTTYNLSNNMYIFARNEMGTATTFTSRKLYYFKIYDGNTLARDFIPCYRNSDNEVGLYDIVNNVFYANQGTGAFTYGATVTVPNPEYPIPIEVVTGNNVIKHVGKNWFNSEMEKGDISYTTGNNTSSSNRVRTKDFIPVFPNETYILKRYSFTGKQLGLRLYDQNQNYLGYKSAATTETITFATNEYSTADGTFSGEIYYIKLIDLENDLNATYQLELGSAATEYEPYKEKAYQLNLGNIELCKIGDYEDEPFKNVVGDENYNAELESGAWYKKKVFDKEILDNNTVINSVAQSTGNPDYTYVYSNILDNKVKLNANTLFMCDCFRTHTGKMIKSTQVNTDSINISNSDNNMLLRFMILTSRLTEQTNAAVKVFFNSIKPVLYYELREPVYEKITDTTLISQLEALNKFKWFKGVNHIWTETDNLEPVLEGKYKAVVESEVS